MLPTMSLFMLMHTYTQIQIASKVCRQEGGGGEEWEGGGGGEEWEGGGGGEVGVRKLDEQNMLRLRQWLLKSVVLPTMSLFRHA